MNESDRKLFVQIIGQLLIADGALSDGERSHLDEVMDSLSMPPEARKAAMSGVSLDSPIEERVRALSPEARQHLLAAAETAIHVDGEATKAELEMVAAIRASLGG
jgi:uncharacterized tellurite resistance protein B-like protein